MASEKISQFPTLNVLDEQDFFPVVQNSDTSNKKVLIETLDGRYFASASGSANASGIETKYDKTGGGIEGYVSVDGAALGVISQSVQGGSINLDLTQNNNFDVTLTSTSVLNNPVNPSGGQSGAVIIRQDAAGFRTLSYGGNWKFAGGVTPTLTTAASGVDVLSYYVASPSEIQAQITLNLS